MQPSLLTYKLRFTASLLTVNVEIVYISFFTTWRFSFSENNCIYSSVQQRSIRHTVTGALYGKVLKHLYKVLVTMLLLARGEPFSQAQALSR